MAAPIIAVLAFDGISPFHLSVPCLVFGQDRTSLGLPRFEFRICAASSGPIHAEAGLTIAAPYGLEGLDGAEIVWGWFRPEYWRLKLIPADVIPPPGSTGGR